MARWGYRCAIRSWPQAGSEAELRALAGAWLAAHSEPAVCVKLRVHDPWPDTMEPLERLSLGALCSVPCLGVKERVLRLRWPDLVREERRMEVTLGGGGASAAEWIARQSTQGSALHAITA